MTNGFTPNPATDLQAWAIHMDTLSAEKWHTQDGVNVSAEKHMSTIDTRIRKLENRGATVSAYGVMIGGFVCAVLSVATALITQYLIR